MQLRQVSRYGAGMYLFLFIANFLPALLADSLNLFRLVLWSQLLLYLRSFSLHIQKEGRHGLGRRILVMGTLGFLLRFGRKWIRAWNSVGGCWWCMEDLISEMAIAVLQIGHVLRGNLSSSDQRISIRQEPVTDLSNAPFDLVEPICML